VIRATVRVPHQRCLHRQPVVLLLSGDGLDRSEGWGGTYVCGVSGMPTRARRLCPHCSQAYTGRRCPTCQDRRFRALSLRTRPTAGPSPWDSPAWVALSKAYRKAHPLCESHAHDAAPWVRPRSTVVDHVDGLGPSGPRGLDESNLQALCRSCHATKTNRHDGGLGLRLDRL
jgi:hypothetical protein